MKEVLDWRGYQEKVARFFRSLGIEAETDVKVSGVRTQHAIDVLVKSHYVGFDIKWIVECKYWNSRVSKLHVLALREIVSDTGADRGILLAENGFQGGAIEAANLTNVQVTSLSDVMCSASNAINSMKLRELYDRLVWCKTEYWEIPKSLRIATGLRSDVGGFGYSGDWATKIGEDLITKGFRGEYPIIPDEMHQSLSNGVVEQAMPQRFECTRELLDFLEPLVQKLENKIKECKIQFKL